MKPTALLADMKSHLCDLAEPGRYRVRVGMATCGLSAGAGQVYDAFVAAVKEAGLEDVDIKSTGCVGRCDLEPLVEVTRGIESPVMYARVNPEMVKEIVQKHLVGGEVIKEYLD